MPGQSSGTQPLHRLMGDFSGDFLVGAPQPKGLTSNSNYVFNDEVAGSCNPIVGASVTIRVTQAIALDSNQPDTSKGYSFQLNAYSMNGFTCAYQQYTIAVLDGEIDSSINNYAVDTSNSILNWTKLADLDDFKLPAGYELTISLQTDATNAVTGATFIVVD